MQIEYEATYVDINKDEIRNRLKKSGAKIIYPETLQKRIVFSLPEGHEKDGSWARVRDEGNKITMSVKQSVHGGRIDEQKEINLEIDNFEEGVNFMEFLGCKRKSFQEIKRELWHLADTEITIDEWPFLDPFVEIEGKSEKIVREVSDRLGFDFEKSYFGPVGGIYSVKYGISLDVINNQTPEIIFEGKNPFEK